MILKISTKTQSIRFKVMNPKDKMNSQQVHKID